MHSSPSQMLQNPDSESLQEFIEALSDHVPNIERDIALLKQKPGDTVLIADLSAPCTPSREMRRCARLKLAWSSPTQSSH